MCVSPVEIPHQLSSCLVYNPLYRKKYSNDADDDDDDDEEDDEDDDDDDDDDDS